MLKYYRKNGKLIKYFNEITKNTLLSYILKSGHEPLGDHESHGDIFFIFIGL